MVLTKGVGGKVDVKSGSIDLNSGSQVYDLQRIMG